MNGFKVRHTLLGILVVAGLSLSLSIVPAYAAKTTSGSASSKRPDSSAKTTGSTSGSKRPDSRKKPVKYSNKKLNMDFNGNKYYKQSRERSGHHAAGDRSAGRFSRGVISWSGWNRATRKEQSAAEQASNQKRQERSGDRGVTFAEPRAARSNSVDTFSSGVSEVLTRAQRSASKPNSSKISNMKKLKAEMKASKGNIPKSQ